MKTKIQQLKDSESELEVELEKDELKEYLRKAGNNLSGLFQVDGFRPGKAPLDVLRQKIGDQKILEEALELAVADSLAKALEKEKIRIISSSDLKIIKNTPELLRYSVKILAFPEVQLGEYKNFGIAPRPVEVEDGEVERVLSYLLKSRAVLKESEESAKKGDHLEIDFEVASGNAAIEGGQSRNHPFILGEGNFIPGFEDQLLGLKSGDSRKFSLVAPADYYQKDIAGKKLDFSVTVRTIKTVTLSKPDDEFARSVGNFQSLKELRESLAEGLKLEKEQKEKGRVRLHILDKINETTRIKIPAKLIERQLDEMIANFDHSLHQRGLELSLYLAQLKKTQTDLRKEWAAQAEKQIRQALILKEIGYREKIMANEEEDALWRQKIFEFLEKANKQKLSQ